MNTVGKISKMLVQATNPVTYHLPMGEPTFGLNPYLGKIITLEFTQKITCSACGIDIKKSYQGGYCFPCTQRLAQCDLCIVKPERCHFAAGTCREPTWGQLHCMSPHIVYLANSSGIKVGITRKTQIPARWIDQGAVTAIPLFEVLTRRLSGLVEVMLAKYVPDKTNWRQMLKGSTELDLLTLRQELLQQAKDDLASVYKKEEGNIKLIEASSLYNFTYPILEHPVKITSLSFDKTPKITAKLLGIKGQYLIFESGVINMRKYSGYEIALTL